MEFKHDQALEQDMQELRSALINARSDSGPQSVTVSVRPAYPSRFLLSNGGPAAGSFRTVQTGSGKITSTNVDLANVCGVGDPGDPDDPGDQSSVEVNHIVQQPSYNYYSGDSPHRYENTVYYRDTGSSLLNRTGQVFVRPSPSGTGGVISIYPIQGGF